MDGSIEFLKKGFVALEKHVSKRKIVVASRSAQSAADAAGGDDDVDDDADPTTRPTRREALSAAATLQSFVTTLGDTYARKLDALLATFGRQTQLEATNAMLDTSITDFFTRTN
ncbi:hypothetical protein B0H11DRAFT_2227302 [Mycena galericulata]|nr:hypothetical protein B0H11DRAFT_2227302 [Mycena galericulata]